MSFAKFFRQTAALTVKNAKLQRRSANSTATQLLIGVVFLILLLLMDVAIKANQSLDVTRQLQTSPDVRDTPAAPEKCVPLDEDGECFQFLYTVSKGTSAIGQAKVESVVDAMVDIGGYERISTKGFVNETVMSDFMLANPGTSRAAVIFENSNFWGVTPQFDYTLQVNFTQTCKELGAFDCDSPLIEVAIPMQNLIDAAFVKANGGPSNPRISTSYSDFPHPELQSNYDVVAQYGTTFLYIAVTFNYVIQLNLIVKEKELHLTESMHQMGMIPAAYWMSWFIVDTVINTLMVALLLIFGYAIGLELFQETSIELLITFFWMSAMAFTGLAFFFSTLTRTTSAARLIGIIVFIVTFIGSPILVLSFYADPTEDYNLIRDILALLPFVGFFQVLETYIGASSGATNTGLEWEDRLNNLLPPKSTNVVPTVWTVERSLLGLLYGFLIFVLLTWYFDNVIPTENGRANKPWFFLLPSYWRGSAAAVEEGVTEGGIHFHKYDGNANRIKALKSKAPRGPKNAAKNDEDVQMEVNIVLDSTYPKERDVAVELVGLAKVFKSGICGDSFTAVDHVSYGIDYDQCFVLLGHNGAGKTTTVNMLTGLSNVTRGDAFVFGYSVRKQMASLFPIMGVCPQHDVLWDSLTAAEHLAMFARVKGVPEDQVESEIRDRLHQVKLDSVANERVGGFSGGMKRRLSIAIAFIGNPRIVFLDEPTTGMDPVTRREVWTMINRAKQGRVIILTTHSMEEADILGDRIAVMSRGRIQALGTSLRLKDRFGSGYRMTMFASTHEAESNVTKFMEENGPAGTELSSSVQGAMLFQIPRQENRVALVEFFQNFEANKDRLGVKEYSLGLTTLEEVFLNLSNQDEFLTNAQLINKQQSKDTEKGAIASTAESVTLGNQLNALLRKQITYQRKQKLSCCFIVSAPLLIMLLLIVLESLIFDDLKRRIVCGEDVSKAQCAELGLKLSCVEDLFSFNPAITPTIRVGVIDEIGIRGAGINPNCDINGCYDGLEVPTFSNISVGAFGDNATPDEVGFIQYSGSNDEQLRDWYMDVKFVLENRTCEEAYSKALSSSELRRAKDWKDADNGLSSAGINSCLPDSSGKIVKPPDSVLQKLEIVEAAQQACLQEQLGDLFSMFDPAWNFTDAFESMLKQSDGLLDHFTTTIVEDPVLTSVTSKLLSAASSLILGSIGGGSGGGGGPAVDLDFLFSLNLQTFCVTPSLKSLLQAFATTAQLDNMCLVALNGDKLRLLGTNSKFESRKELTDSLLDKWYGEEIQTDFMAANADKLSESSRYKARFYSAEAVAYDFTDLDAANGIYNFTVFFNNSGAGNPLAGLSSQNDGNWIGNTWLMNNAIVKSHTGFGVNFKYKRFPSSFECNRDEWASGEVNELKCDILPPFLALSILDFVGIALFPYIFMLEMFIVVNLIVYEKEKRLTIQMKMMGLRSSVYWVVTYVFYLLQFAVLAALVWIMGNVANLQMFTIHDPMVMFFFLFSWGNLLVAFSFLLSVFFNNTTTSTAFVFLGILIMNTVGTELLTNLIQDPNTTEASYAALLWLPPLVLIRTLIWLSLSGAFKQPITLKNWTSFGGGAIPSSLGIMWIEWLICLILLWYLDKVWVSDFGVREPWLFFLDKEYWTRGSKKAKSRKDAAAAVAVEHLAHVDIAPGMEQNMMYLHNEDIESEYESVVDPNTTGLLARVVRLHKRFGEFVAVKSVSLGINKKECFGLLGHNGAGKTTTLNMLTGLFEPTSGDAVVDDLSIKHDLPQIQARMGVCPQHNVLWDALSVEDHLLFYGRLKGLTGSKLKRAVVKALEDVNLKKFRGRASGKLSGGMKRRLSVAISLIGDPKIVYLDEPSTGLDPASRRQLWEVISRAKGSKSIVLTTHSMEEAEVLCDRVGIMALGELQCIGQSSVIKNRFGAGYTCTIMGPATQKAYDDVYALVKGLFPSAKLAMEPLGGVSRYEVDRSEVVLSKVFQELEDAKEIVGILDWGLTETTLEDCFLHLAEEAHVEEAMSSPVDSKNRNNVALELKKQEEKVIADSEVDALNPTFNV